MVEESKTGEDGAHDSNQCDENWEDLAADWHRGLLIDMTDRKAFPHLDDYIQIGNEYGTLVLSLPDYIQFSGKTQCTVLNFAALPDMFTATGVIGPATPGAGIDDALLVIAERACNEMIHNLTGLTNCSLIFDISHHQHADLASSVVLQREMRGAHMVTAEVISDHINNVLGVERIEGPKFGFSCGKNANWTLDDTAQCTGAGTLNVIDRIGALPVANITYPRDGNLSMDAIIERYVLDKFKALDRVGAFDGKLNPDAAEYMQEMEVALEALKATAHESTMQHMKAMGTAEAARRARDGSTAAQHDQNVNVAAPAMRAAEAERRRIHGRTAA